MKKIILVLSMLMIFLGAMAQDLSVKSPKYSTFWGTTSDTLVISDSITYDIRVTSKQFSVNVNLGLYVTKVSGTVTNNFVVYGSMDGTNYSDSLTAISLTNASTGMQTAMTLTNFNYPYLRIQGESPATAQKAWYKVYYYIKEN